MKKQISLIVMFTVLALFCSCSKKAGVHPTTGNNDIMHIHIASIVTKWMVVSDTVNQAVGASEHDTIYNGVSSDYFDFRADHKLYIKEGSTLDTLSYNVLTDSTMTITPLVANAIPFSAWIPMVTANTAMIFWSPSLANPGSFYSRHVRLKR